MSRTLPKGFTEDPSVQKYVLKFFSSFDNQIKGLQVTRVPNEEDEQDEQFIIEAKHKRIHSDDSVMIPLSDESDGTLKMFALYPKLHTVLEKGSVLFVGELNARLHPLLVRNFILTFANPKINVNHAQLIFTKCRRKVPCFSYEDIRRLLFSLNLSTLYCVKWLTAS